MSRKTFLEDIPSSVSPHLRVPVNMTYFAGTFWTLVSDNQFWKIDIGFLLKRISFRLD